MTTPQIASDEELASLASAGEREAFGALYQRHFQGVYDLVVRMVRDRDLAADVVQSAFIRAWENLQRKKVSGNVRAWLYTIARNNAIDELRRGKRLVSISPEDPDRAGALRLTDVDESRLSDPEDVVQDQELVDLVWTSAAALSPQEYSLLDLHLRKDLGAEELAASLGVSRQNLYTRLSRLRDALEQSVAVALLIRRGRRDCPELAAILSEQPAGALTRDIRRIVQKHADDCPRCEQSRRRYLAPAEIFSAIALVSAPPEVREAIWLRISGLTAAGGAALGLIGSAVDGVLDWWGGATAPVKGAVVGSGGLMAGLTLTLTLLLVSTGGDDAVPGTASAVPARGERRTAVAAASATPVPPSEAPPAAPGPTPAPTPVATSVVAAPIPTPRVTVPPPPTTPPTPPPTLGPQTVTFDIEIRVGTPANGLNLGANATFEVTLVGTPAFPVADVALDSVTFVGAPVWRSKVHDVDSDGDDDLVLHFRVSETNVAPSDTVVCLEGETVQGIHFRGCGFARILPSPARNAGARRLLPRRGLAGPLTFA